MVSALAVLLLLQAHGQDPDGRVTIHSYGLGKMYTVTITDGALNKAPVWKDDAEHPPLSPRKAMKLAGAVKDRLVKDTVRLRWEQESVALYEADQGRWYWLVTFEGNPTTNGGMTGRPPTLRLVVLMDGTVVEPVVTDEKER